MNKRIAHNFTWGPIFIIGIIANILGVILCMHKEPWLLNQIPNEALLQTSFSILFSEKINIGLPLFLSMIYRFFGIWLLTIGSIIICYVYELTTTSTWHCFACSACFACFAIYFVLKNLYIFFFSNDNHHLNFLKENKQNLNCIIHLKYI